MNKHLQRLFLVALILLGGSSAWAQTTTLLEYGTGDVAWTDANLAEWTAGGSPTITGDYVAISGGNGSYATSKTIAPEANSIIKVSAVWRGRSNTGRAFSAGNGSYFRFGNIVVAQNDQDKKHGYVFTGLDNMSSVTTFTHGSYRADIASLPFLLIEMEINTATNTMTSFAVKSEDGSTTIVSATDVVLTNADYTTVAFGYKKSGSVGTTNNEHLKSIKITQTVQAVETASYTIKYMCGGQEVKDAESRTGVVGSDITLTAVDTQNFDSSDGTMRYIYESDDAAGKTIAGDGSTVVTVTVREAEKWSYTITSSYNGTPLPYTKSGSVWEDQNTINVSYPRFQAAEAQLVERVPVSNNLQQSFTVTSNGFTGDLEYSAVAGVDNLFLLSEAENLETTLSKSATNYTSRVSNGQIVHGAEGTLLTLPAGKYIFTLGAIGGSNDHKVAYVVKADETTIAEGTCTGNMLDLFTGSEFTLTKETPITFTCSDPASTRGIDLIYVQKTGNVSLAVTRIASAEGNTGTNGTNPKFYQKANGKMEVSLHVTLQNTGDVDLDTYTLTPGYGYSEDAASEYLEDATVTITDHPIAAGETTGFQVTFETPYVAGNAGYNYWFVRENVSGTSWSPGRWAQSIAYEPKFVFRAATTSSETSLSTPEAWGVISESTTKGYEIRNLGIAPLKIKSITWPEGFTCTSNHPTGEFEIAAGSFEYITITQPATAYGTFNGTLTIVYLDKNDAEQTYTLDFSATVLNPNAWAADFNNSTSTIVYPEGALVQGGIDKDYQYISSGNYNNWITGRTSSSYATDNNKFITPLLHANAGDKLSFEVKGAYGSSYFAKVYVSTDRQNWGEPVAYYTYGETEGAEAVGSGTWQAKSISFDEAGDYYVAFALYGKFSIDNIIGLEKVAVAHDLFIKEVRWPEASIKSGVAQTKPVIDIIPLTNETADNYTVKYIYGDNVVTIDSKALTASASSTTSFTASFTPEVEQTTTFEGTKVVFEFTDGTKFETEPFDLTVTNEPLFHFLGSKYSSRWYEPSSDYTTPVSFGKTNEPLSKTFWILNWGSAPLNVKSIAMPEGFSASVSEMTLPAFDGTQAGLDIIQQSFDITFSATEAGEYSGDMVITYVNGAGEDATFTLALSGTMLDPTKFYANFGSDSNQWPAGSVYQNNVSTTYMNTGNYAATCTSTTNNLFITPKLKAGIGDKMQFDAAIYPYGSWSNGKVVVYTAATREELVEFDPENDTRTVLFSVSGQDEVNPITTDMQTFEFAVPAGEQYLAFEISNRPFVDEIYGLQLAEVAHDWTLVSSNIPAEAMQNIPSNATVNILNLGLQDEENYKLLVHIGDEVTTINGTTKIEMKHKMDDAGTAISVPVQSPKAGTFPVYIEVKAGAYSVATETVDVTFAEEVFVNDAIEVGTRYSSGSSYAIIDFYNLDGGAKTSDIVYTAEQLNAYGITAGSKIQSLSFRGTIGSAKTISNSLTAWVGLKTGDITWNSPDKSEMTEVKVFEGTMPFTSGVNEITINLASNPIVYDGTSDLRIYFEGTKGGWATVSFAYDSNYQNMKWSNNSSMKYNPLLYVYLDAEPAVLSGIVKNAEGEAVEGATVTLVSTDGNNVQYAGTTDAEGAYTINVIQASREYAATVECGEYTPATEIVALGGESKTQDFVIDMPLGKKYFTNLDLSSTDGWTPYVSGSYRDLGNGLIGTYKVRNEHPASTVDETHLATEYAFGLEARWASSFASYNQNSKKALPEGEYTLVFDVENTNGGTTSATYDNLFKVTVGDQVFADQSTEWMNGKSSWTEHAISFTVTEPTVTNISFGYGTGSNNFHLNNTPALFVSHVQFMTTADYVIYLLNNKKAELQAEIAIAEALQARPHYTAGQNELSAAITDAEAALNATVIDEVTAAIAALQAAELAFKTANNPAEGYYYVYSPVTGKFLSRGNAWGTSAVVDDYGVAVNLKQNDGKYTLTSFDNGITYGDDAWMFADAGGNRARSYELTRVQDGYTLTNTNNNMLVYVYLKEDGNKYRVAGNAIMGDNYTDEAQTVWQFLTKSERDHIVAQRLADQGTEAFAAAGVPVDKELKTYDPVEVSFAAGNDWTASVVREQGGQPAVNEFGSEMWQATGSFTKTLTGLTKGLYRVDVQAFYRNGGADEDQARVGTGFNTVLAYFEANGNKVPVQTWTSGKGEGNDPNSMSQAKAKFDEGKYVSSVYTYVGEDGKLDLKVNNPAFINNGWFIAGNVKYTRTKEFIRGDLNDDDVVDQLDLAIKQAEGRENAKPKMNAETRAALNAAIAAAVENGDYLANMDAIDAAIADAQASAEAYAAVPEVALVVNKTNVYTPQAYIAYANDADRKATIAAYNAGTLTNEEALAFREQMFTNESVVGKLLLSAWGENPALSVAADGSLVATGNVTATMVNVENGIYDVTADVQTEADATFEATGREAVAVAAELAAEAELKEQGNLTLTFNVPAGATVTFRNLWFELNREKTAGRDKEDELADAKAKWEAAMADLQKAYDEAVELKESVEESTLEAESVAELNDAIAAGGLLLGEDIALVTTSDYVNKTKELTAAAKRLRAITLKVKRFITVGIDGVVAGKLDLNAPMYDMNGKRVDRNYRGIVIQNGQKFRRK